MGTLIFVAIIYTISALSLTGMEPFQDISGVSGFPAAFGYNNATFSSQLTALGEIVTLPIVVLLTTMAQPRLQFALAEDGLIPAWFGKQNSRGNLINGTVFAGSAAILGAAFIPFAHLNDMISCSVLIALSITDTSVIVLWHESPDSNPLLGDSLMMAFNAACLVVSVTTTHFFAFFLGKLVAVVFFVVMIGCVVMLVRQCPKSTVFGGRRGHPKGGVRQDDGYFRTPFVPYWPCFGIFINWYLLAQLHLIGIIGTLLFLGVTTMYYYLYAIHHSVGNTGAWNNAQVK